MHDTGLICQRLIEWFAMDKRHLSQKLHGYYYLYVYKKILH